MLRSGSKKGFLLVKIDFAFLPTTFIVCCVLVHCRVGSLEMSINRHQYIGKVHCRVGSLENVQKSVINDNNVHCRVGSLEIDAPSQILLHQVHCRVGSLENIK